MLIIEGPDAVGKTTFAQKCVEYMREYQPDLPVIGQAFGMLPAKWDYYADYLPYVTPYAVMDRFVMSEVAYGAVCRNRVGFVTQDRLNRVQAELDRVASFTVVITAATDDDMRELFLRAKEKRPEEFKVEQVVRVNQAFSELVDGEEIECGSECFKCRSNMYLSVTADRYSGDDAVKRACDRWTSRLMNRLTDLRAMTRRAL